MRAAMRCKCMSCSVPLAGQHEIVSAGGVCKLRAQVRGAIREAVGRRSRGPLLCAAARPRQASKRKQKGRFASPALRASNEMHHLCSTSCAAQHMCTSALASARRRFHLSVLCLRPRACLLPVHSAQVKLAQYSVRAARRTGCKAAPGPSRNSTCRSASCRFFACLPSPPRQTAASQRECSLRPQSLGRAALGIAF